MASAGDLPGLCLASAWAVAGVPGMWLAIRIKDTSNTPQAHPKQAPNTRQSRQAHPKHAQAHPKHTQGTPQAHPRHTPGTPQAHPKHTPSPPQAHPRCEANPKDRQESQGITGPLGNPSTFFPGQPMTLDDLPKSPQEPLTNIGTENSSSDPECPRTFTEFP